jgi:hypothetical protein
MAYEKLDEFREKVSTWESSGLWAPGFNRLDEVKYG